ncbi:Fluoride export protein 1 [Cladobotryum mycophilum]|uniref:Fluoride export protein 1 n=1 Tax=Cladobotryum mycophilum TaxID=491253 RepID=A0ABR0SQZ2_9HYPO
MPSPTNEDRLRKRKMESSSARDASNASDARRSISSAYNPPDSYQNMNDVGSILPVGLHGSGSPGRLSQGQGQGIPRSGLEVEAYNMPPDWANLDEVAATSPVENVHEAPIYTHRSLEQTRSWTQERRRGSGSSAGEESGEEGRIPAVVLQHSQQESVSQLATETYTISYLIFFAILGTLARVGLTALTSYPGAPVIFSVIWANFSGSLVMGFLSEDRMLFRDEWGTPTYDQQIALAKMEHDASSRSTQSQHVVDLVAAKRAHLATKKTIPLYIGLATGFCGSFTSFSSFIRDIYLALSNSMVAPGYGGSPEGRNGGYSFMALIAIIITTVALSLAGLIVGAHLAIFTERYTPSIPYPVTRKVIDPLAVLLGWGCWAGAIFMAIFPPHDRWRGEILFSLVFAPLGCLLRFYLSVRLNGKIPSFPLGTFVANIFGTAMLGMAWDLAHAPIGGVIACQILQGIEDGFCGCLTTISTWVTELISLKRRHAYLYGAASIVVATATMIAIMGGQKWTGGVHGIQCVP